MRKPGPLASELIEKAAAYMKFPDLGKAPFDALRWNASITTPAWGLVSRLPHHSRDNQLGGREAIGSCSHKKGQIERGVRRPAPLVLGSPSLEKRGRLRSSRRKKGPLAISEFRCPQ